MWVDVFEVQVAYSLGEVYHVGIQEDIFARWQNDIGRR